MDAAIVLPAALMGNREGWKVNYGSKVVKIDNGLYKVPGTTGDFYLKFVEDANGKEVLEI